MTAHVSSASAGELLHRLAGATVPPFKLPCPACGARDEDGCEACAECQGRGVVPNPERSNGS